MKCFALTGGIACGKSTVSAMLKNAGIPVINADDLAKEAVKAGSRGLSAIVNQFGTSFLNEKGELDRKKMAMHIFSDENQRKKLEQIIHPLVAEGLQNELKKYLEANTPFVVYEAPLIFEKGLDKLFDATILVATSIEFQLDRLQNRDNLDLNEAKKRLSAQMSTEGKKKRATYVIDNSKTQSETLRELKNVWLKLTDKPL